MADRDRWRVVPAAGGVLWRDAGAALEKTGFTQVYNVLHGFEGELNDQHQRNSISGWRHEGLPWEHC